MNLPYSRQCIDEDDILAVARVLRSDYLTTGPELERFESEFAEYCGAKYAIACSNGTAALHLACLSLGVNSSQRVITSPLTFLSTANVAHMSGAGVDFIDVDPHTLQIDVDQVEALLKKSPTGTYSAVIPVHFTGHPAPMGKIHALAKAYDLWVIEDASHALGAAYRDGGGERIQVGDTQNSNLACFSFHATKNITGGEGGAVTTNDQALYERLKLFRSHGMTRIPQNFKDKKASHSSEGELNPWYYEMHALGYNYRITDFQCALLSSQLKKYPEWLSKRRTIANEYRQLINANFGDELKPLGVNADIEHGHHLFVIRIKFDHYKITRASFMNQLNEVGIGTQVHYIPLTAQPYYKEKNNLNHLDYPNANQYYEEALSLPFYSSMPENAPQYVVGEMKRILKG
jgi:UDP-4-amino-4,6-dideoxy-N-acetyl-beta-L-altrosamine transaminase